MRRKVGVGQAEWYQLVGRQRRRRCWELRQALRLGALLLAQRGRKGRWLVPTGCWRDINRDVIFCLQVQFLNAYYSWGWARPTPGGWNSIQVLCVGGGDRTLDL